MQLILDFPTVGEPHYAQACPADLIKSKSVKFFKIEENTNPYVSKGEGETKWCAKVTGSSVDDRDPLTYYTR